MTYAPQGDENNCTVYEPGHFLDGLYPVRGQRNQKGE